MRNENLIFDLFSIHRTFMPAIFEMDLEGLFEKKPKMGVKY
jgi:hypothetical protein